MSKDSPPQTGRMRFEDFLAFGHGWHPQWFVPHDATKNGSYCKFGLQARVAAILLSSQHAEYLPKWRKPLFQQPPSNDWPSVPFPATLEDDHFAKVFLCLFQKHAVSVTHYSKILAQTVCHNMKDPMSFHSSVFVDGT
eukprot:1883317-Amphidinium_carterae.1